MMVTDHLTAPHQIGLLPHPDGIPRLSFRLHGADVNVPPTGDFANPLAVPMAFWLGFLLAERWNTAGECDA